MSKLASATGALARDNALAQANNHRFQAHLESQQMLAAEMRTLTNLMQQWLPQEVLWSGTVTVGAPGTDQTAELNFRSPASSLFVVNNGPTSAAAQLPNISIPVSQVINASSAVLVPAVTGGYQVSALTVSSTTAAAATVTVKGTTSGILYGLAVLTATAPTVVIPGPIQGTEGLTVTTASAVPCTVTATYQLLPLTGPLGMVTVYAGGRLATPPTTGIGRHQVNSGAVLLLNQKSAVFSFYGFDGGEILDVQAFGRYMPPVGSTGF